MFSYEDIKESGIPISVWCMELDCSPNTIKAWSKRVGFIPKQYDLAISNVFAKKFGNKQHSIGSAPVKKEFSPLNNNDLHQYSAVFEDAGFPSLINDLDEKPAKAAPLVSITKSQAKNENFKIYSQLTQYKPKSLDEDVDVLDYLLVDRFELQALVRNLLPESRTSECMHKTYGGDVVVHRSVEHGNKAFYSNLAVCGSVWRCPICAVKISNRRALEIKAAFDKHKASGGYFSFVTRTIPHTASDSFESIKEQFAAADAKLMGYSRYKNLLASFGVVGRIKVYELTITQNGWHLHVHEIYFHSFDYSNLIPIYFEFRELDDPLVSLMAFLFIAHTFSTVDFCFHEALKEGLYPLWLKAAQAAGFDAPSFEHGLSVQNGDFAADYIAKFGREPADKFWGIDKEMTRQHTKTSRSGLTPFDLLRQYRDTGLKMYADLFVEYATVIPGTRQLNWSRGLKARFAIDEKTDDEIALEQDELSTILGRISGDEWAWIAARGYKAKILIIARHLGWQGIQELLQREYYNIT